MLQPNNHEIFKKQIRTQLFDLMELTHQSYESLIQMPYSLFDEFYTWKIDMEKEKIKRQKSELEQQKQLRSTMEGKRRINEARTKFNKR